ncbi:MAG: translesion error-prone DNA polymerase V autoproteolytic subunit [Bacteroidota bacterium]
MPSATIHRLPAGYDPISIDAIYLLDGTTQTFLPLFVSSAPAGVPAFIDDDQYALVDLSQLLAPNPTNTFLVRTSGDSMRDAGIQAGDLLVVDRSITARHNSIVIASLNGAVTVKRFQNRHGRTVLVPENPNYQPIEIRAFDAFTVLGVVRGFTRMF